MPSDEYAAVARGPLKLKGGAGVTKKSKKKKDKGKGKAATDLEKNLSTGGGDGIREGSEGALVPAGEDGAPEEVQKEDGPSASASASASAVEDDYKTEAERRFAEIKRKRLKELAESKRVRPELLKTHKQRVEELNAHLARLSEHHDMPKIGPG
ncbi:hypothetical protein VTH06DRAFT_6554 [Thermothelomyces fergusii]